MELQYRGYAGGVPESREMTTYLRETIWKTCGVECELKHL